MTDATTTLTLTGPVWPDICPAFRIAVGARGYLRYVDDFALFHDDAGVLAESRERGRVLRGGSWNNKPDNVRAANRNRNDTENRNNNAGFRPASIPHRRSRPVQGRGGCARVCPGPAMMNGPPPEAANRSARPGPSGRRALFLLPR